MGLNPFPQEYRYFHFLVVDDDEEVRNVLKLYLAKFGFHNIEEAKSGSAALMHLHNYKKHFDIVLSDWDMPDPNGITLLKAVRNDPRRKNIKFIMITSQVEREKAKIHQALQWQVDDYIVKPFTGATLRDKLARALDIEESTPGAKSGT
jgi:two-component system, chemotaxis family, chemotaxis protein CheY